MKKVTFSVEETRSLNYDITINVKNKDLKAFEDGEIDEDELKEMYDEQIEKATANAKVDDYEIEDRWFELTDYDD